MERINKVYQLLTVNHSNFHTSIIPDSYVYTNEKDARIDINARIITFAQNGEKLNYKGVIKSIRDIADIYQEHSDKEYCDIYIYEIYLINI